MLQLGYSSLALDPETGAEVPDPSWFPASYYSINCPDYTEPGADAATAMGPAQALETELPLSIGLSNWDGEAPLTIGCNYGGAVSIGLGIDDDTAYTFAACIWWPGIVIDGTGLEVLNDDPGDGLSLDLTSSGHHADQIAYHNNTYAEAWVISGAYDGQEVSVRE